MLSEKCFPEITITFNVIDKTLVTENNKLFHFDAFIWRYMCSDALRFKSI